jgi:crotonobetainyl-CoA:carnitine CoA-transferase CaiB-like acyl-CoA transferase
MVKPLDGVRICEISQVYSLPFAGMMLADLGAEVIKVENPLAPEIMRRGGNIRAGIPSAFLNLNRGKRFLGVDASRPEGAGVLSAVIDRCDVVLSNLRPGKLAKIGVDLTALRGARPELVTVDITGFGVDGPMRDLPCYDFVIQAMTGMIDYQRNPADGSHDLVRNFVVDKAVSHTIVESVLAALLQKARTGVGQHVDINMLDVGMHFLWPDGMAKYTYVDPVVERPVGDGGDSYRVYPTLDGAVAMMPGLSNWPELCAVMERLDLVDDPRFATRLAQLANNVEAMRIIGEALCVMSNEVILANCAAFDVPVARVHTRPEAFTHPQIVANQTIRAQSFDGPGQAYVPQTPWHFHGSDVVSNLTIGLLGADSSGIASECGFSSEQISIMIDRGILHQAQAITPTG